MTTQRNNQRRRLRLAERLHQLRRVLGGPIGLWIIAGQGPAIAQPVNNCVQCHVTLSEVNESLSAPVRAFEDDVHARAGLSCVDCHGGNATLDTDDQDAAMDPAKGYVGVPKPAAIPALCGRCHSNAAYMARFNPNLRVDQEALYRTSHHGEKLAAGNTRVATCVSCHGAHGIRPPNHPASPVFKTNIPETCGRCHADSTVMAGSGLPTNQLELYRGSVHGLRLLKHGDLGAPSCNSCHGNHGATPPGVASVHNVCGVCHPSNDALFSASSHRAHFQEMDFPGCVTCHHHHDIRQLTAAAVSAEHDGVCELCHGPSDDGGLAAAAMRSAIQAVEARQDSARLLVSDAERKGMEVSEAQYILKEVNSAVVKTGNLLHGFAVASVEEAAQEGRARAGEAMRLARAALHEYQVRRQGLGVSLLFLVFGVLTLYAKIRAREAAHRTRRSTSPPGAAERPS